MAAEIESNFGLAPELIAGSSGIFEVRKDGEIACPKAQRLRRAIIEAVKIGYAAKAPQQESKKGARVQVCRDQAKEIRRLAREAYSKWTECHEVEINPLPAMD